MLAAVGIAVCVGASWSCGWPVRCTTPSVLRIAPLVVRVSGLGASPAVGALIGVAVVCVGLAIVDRSYFADLAVGALWVRVLGLAVLVASTVFTLWARFSLGTMWSVAPKVKGDHQLRTRGPYAVTRHPIYTGALGMLIGATLLSGIGQWIVLFPVALIVFEVKIRMEERLMVATFPDEYPRYRTRVPQLVPGLYVLRQRQSARS